MTRSNQSLEERQERIRQYAEDREQLLDSLTLRYPALRNLVPSQNVESVITEVCRFHVVDEPLPLGQLAVCDFENRCVIVNSEMERFVDKEKTRVTLRLSTLAHELGHIRLHHHEVAQGLTINYFGDSGQFSDARAYQKEREADLYAAVFLVPLPLLLKQGGMQKLMQNRKTKKPMTSASIWKQVYIQAERLQVSPTLLKRCLVEHGIVETGKARKNGSCELMLKC